MGFKNLGDEISPLDDGGSFDTGEVGEVYVTPTDTGEVEEISSTSAASNAAIRAANSAANAATSETNAADSETNAATSASAASTNASAAATSATAAQTAQTAAELAETNAETAETNAETAETNAQASAAAALASETAAAASSAGVDAYSVAAQAAATAASASETAASTSETNASISEANAANSATASASSATASSASATASAASETAAAASETAAAASESAAAASESAAAASESAAAASETAAGASETNAAGSATTASTKASEASTSAANASTSETNAATSASAASTSATNAGTSEANAADSASAAATSETNAATSETNADASKTAAATSETNAATSESNAASSASAASTSASNAATSESNAASSASAASTSATNAATSASAASTSETNAAASETNAANSATASASSATASAASSTAASASETAAAASEAAASASETAAAESEVAAGVSETNAAVSATSAGGSASAASTSASNAATSESNAASSASLASTSETNAAASESAASTSESNAATSETNAATSASASATSATASAGSATASSSSATAAASSENAAATSEGNAATSAANAATSATNASTSATAAASSASSASASADAALAALDSFDDRYLGQKASDPTVDNDGNPLVAGALYFNTTDDSMKVYDGANWLAAYTSLSGALIATNNLSDVLNVAAARTNLGLGTAATTASTDYATAAQGGLADSAVQPEDLSTVATTGAYSDLSGKPTLGTAAATDSTAYATAAQGSLADSAVQPNDSPSFGSVAVSGTVDGRDIAADGSKLDGIEAGADVTDTANVTAAGALMDSEVTNLAQVKSFDSSDYATAAQGTLADSALQAGDNISELVNDSGYVTTDTNTTYTAGSGLSLVGTEFTNTAPDQTVAITGGANVTVTGTYPNFTIASTDTNTELSSEQVQDIVGAMFTGNTESGISVVYQDTDGTIDLNVNDPTITLSGDVSGSATMTNLGNVTISVTIADDSHNHTIANVDGLQTALDGKVDDSQVLTNVPLGAVFTDTTYSNVSEFTNDSGYATTTYVDQAEADAISTASADATSKANTAESNANSYTDTAVANIVDTAPATLDTLNELAAALGDDPNFATTVSNNIGTKVDKTTTVSAGSGLTGGGDLSANRTISHADTSSQASVNNSGGTVIQDITLDTYGHLTGLASTDLDARYVQDVGTTFNGTYPVVVRTAQNDIYSHPSIQFTGGTQTLSVGGNITIAGNSAFHDGYHPNADKWTTARTLSLTGDASGSVSWDGSGNASLSVAVNNDSHSHSNYFPWSSSGSIDVNTQLGSGVYQGSTGSWTNRGPSVNNAGALFNINTHPGAYYSQLWFDSAGDNFYHRGINNDTTPSATWDKVWTSGNDGSGSGLDADLLDGQQGSYYYPASNPNGYTTYTANQALNTTSNPTFNDVYVADQILHSGDTNTYMQFHAADQWRVVTGGAERLEVNNSQVTVTGNFLATGNVTAYSDERLKSNIKTIDNAVDTVKQLRGVTFEKDGADSLGVIAQEVQKVLPELVLEGEEYLSVAYGNMVGLLIEAIKEQQLQIEDLKNKVN